MGEIKGGAKLPRPWGTKLVKFFKLVFMPDSMEIVKKNMYQKRFVKRYWIILEIEFQA